LVIKRLTHTDAVLHIKRHDVSPEGLKEKGKQSDELNVLWTTLSRWQVILTVLL